MADQWRCIRNCLQHVFGNPDPNACRRYDEDEMYFIPTESREEVTKTGHFDLIVPDPNAVPVPVDPTPPASIHTTPATPLQSVEDRPVESLYRMSDGMKAGLNDHGIYTIGDLRDCLATSRGERELLESSHANVGPGAIKKFKIYLDMNLTEQDKE